MDLSKIDKGLAAEYGILCLQVEIIQARMQEMKLQMGKQANINQEPPKKVK